MNYYPGNPYGSYNYGGGSHFQYPQSQPTQQMMQMQSSQTQVQPQQPTPALQGKIVDGEEMVKATEVPFGGYGLFPKADLSEIYIKSWNNNGTTQIISYKPTIKEQKEEVDPNAIVLEKMKIIEEKLDSIINNKTTTVPKKELKVNEY
jgi:hypothetical protein